MAEGDQDVSITKKLKQSEVIFFDFFCVLYVI